MTRPLTLAGSALLALALVAPTRADGPPEPPPAEPTSRLYAAGDLLRWAPTIGLRDATYVLWAWSDGSTRWAPSRRPVQRDEAPGVFDFAPGIRFQELIFTPVPQGPPGRPRWARLGAWSTGRDERVNLNFQGEHGGAIPPLVAVSTDPDFDPTRALDLVRGDVKATAPPADARRNAIRTETTGANFDPPGSLDAWRARAVDLRDQLRVALGLWPEPPRDPRAWVEVGGPASPNPYPEVLGTLDRDGYAIDRVVLETMPGHYLAGNLYRPTRGAGRHPAVLCPHGHWPDGRTTPDVQARCAHLARLGCVVFLYDMVGYGDSKPFEHTFKSADLDRHGLGLAGLQAWNSIRALDWIAARPDVDATRIAVTGESGGATQTILLTALDPRVSVAAPVVMVSDSYQGGCECENALGLRLGTDNVEIAALAAPRPLKVVGASGDWTARAITNAYPTLQLVYGRYGASDRLSADVFDFPHNYNRTSRDAVYAFFGRWLLGLPPGSETREGDDPRTEKAADLLAFDEAHPYPPSARGAGDLAQLWCAQVRHEVAKLRPGDAGTWPAGRAALATAHRHRVPIENPSPRDTDAKLVRVVERPGLTVKHFTVGRRADGGLIPVVLLEPKGSANARGALTVVATGRGKVDLATPDGEPSPLARALLDRGQSVVGFDPLTDGEAVDPAHPAVERPAAKHFRTYNLSPAAERMQDLATVASWARSTPGTAVVHLVGTGSGAVPALLARPRLEGIGRTAILLDMNSEDLAPPPYGPSPTSYRAPLVLDLPGLEQFGGFAGAAALAAPAPLWIASPATPAELEWPARAYGLAGASTQLRLDAGPDVTPGAVARWLDSGEVAP